MNEVVKELQAAERRRVLRSFSAEDRVAVIRGRASEGDVEFIRAVLADPVGTPPMLSPEQEGLVLGDLQIALLDRKEHPGRTAERDGEAPLARLEKMLREIEGS